MGVIDRLVPLRDVFGALGLRRRRRTWVTDGRAHIELRAVEHARLEVLAPALEEALIALDSVSWAEVNPFLGRVVAAFDPGRIGLDEIVEAIEETERACEVHDADFPIEPPDHPGDLEPIVRDVASMAGDVMGFGIAAFGRVRRMTPLPIEIDLAALMSVAEGVPRVRHLVENRVTAPIADLALGLANSFAQGLAQGTMGPIVDLTYRASALGELIARRRVWEEREPELCAKPVRPELTAPTFGARPVPVPAGPVETYADRAWFGSLGGFGIALAATRRVERAVAALHAGLPKAARLGREVFASQFGRLLSGRGVLVLDPEALRTLDRVDCLVVQGDLLVGTAHAVSEVEVVGEVPVTTARQRAVALLDPDAPTARRERKGWVLRPDESAARDGDRERPISHELLLLRGDEPVATVRTHRVIRAGADELVAAARRSELRLLLATEEDVGGALEHDGTVRGGRDLAGEVRALQAEGHVVCVVATGSEGLRAADCGVGVHRPPDPPPWEADLFGGDGLAMPFLVAEACAAAREASRQSVQLAAAGAGAGAFLAFGGVVPGSSQRAATAVNVAALMAMANGTRLAMELSRRPVPAEPDPTPWHRLDVDDVLGRLDSSLEGIASDEARRRRVVPAPPIPRAVRLARAVAGEFANPLAPVLAGGAALSAAVGSLSDATMVTAVMAGNALVGGGQRYRADRALERLDRRRPRTARVRRDGSVVEVEPGELVPGDLVVVRAGETVSADCRLIEAHNLEVDESSLTGESLPVLKRARPSYAPNLADRRSMLYEGTSIAAGEAVAVVVATGDETESRRSILLAGAPPASGVEQRLRSLTAVTIPVALLSGAGIVAAGLLRARPLRETVGAGVSLAVAAVPEGLPLLATVAQLGAARRLSTHGALVRNPQAVEALGRVDVLCADKTGTLTVGRIALRRVSDGSEEAEVGELTPTLRDILAEGLRGGPDISEPELLPHPTDRALVAGAEAEGVSLDDGVSRWRRRHELPFEPARGYHAVLGETGEGLRISIKGAPEVLLPRCARRRVDGATRPMHDEDRTALEHELDVLAEAGLRVLAVATRPARDDLSLTDERVRDLTFVGYVALSDPARPAAAAAVADLKDAGVDVIMITGDHPSTARGVGVELGLRDSGSVLVGTELDALDDDELTERLRDVSIVARVTPFHKVRIVRALQESGRVVAMTGDGANDAPAIRLAHCGIALGAESTEAARDAADVVLTDERIETIVDAVIEGRSMWVSVREAVAVLVGGNLGEIGFTLLGSLATGTSPLNARQLLLVNLLTDAAPAMAIALRRAKHVDPAALLEEGPEASLGRALDEAIVWRAAATASGAGAAWIAARLTGTAAHARTVALVALVGAQLGQTVAAGGRDPLVLAAGFGSAGVLAGIVQTPGLSHLFGCRPLGPVGWTIGVTSASAATAGAIAGPRIADGVRRVLG